MSKRRVYLHPLWMLISLPCYVGWRLLPAFATNAWGLVGGIVTLVAACVIVLFAVNTRSMQNRRMADRIAWVGLLTMGFLSTLFVMTVVRDAVLVAARAAVDHARLSQFAAPSAWAAVGITLAFTIAGFVIARRPRVVAIDIPLANLPAALQGFVLAQISDLHVGPTIKRNFMERIVARVNRLNADVIIVTGDLVDGSVRDLGSHTAPLADLEAPHGVYVVTGNHEYYSGERAWTAEIRRLGLTVLKNQHVVLHHGGASLVLAGVTDFTAHHFDPAERSDPAAALLGAPRDAGLKILLAHQPKSAQAASDAGYDLQISGHTHGGQFWPWSFLVRYFQPFVSGLHRLGNLCVYVSVGTGYWGPPNRFFVPGEITRLRLVAAKWPYRASANGLVIHRLTRTAQDGRQAPSALTSTLCTLIMRSSRMNSHRTCGNSTLMMVGACLIGFGAGTSNMVAAAPQHSTDDIAKTDNGQTVPNEPSREPGSKRRLDRSGHKQVGKASFYKDSYAGKTMADGSPMRLYSNNAASLTLPLGTTALVKNLENGKSAIVKIRDRGPYVKGRIVDLSPGTARSIGLSKKQGVAMSK